MPSSVKTAVSPIGFLLCITWYISFCLERGLLKVALFRNRQLRSLILLFKRAHEFFSFQKEETTGIFTISKQQAKKSLKIYSVSKSRNDFNRKVKKEWQSKQPDNRSESWLERCSTGSLLCISETWYVHDSLYSKFPFHVYFLLFFLCHSDCIFCLIPEHHYTWNVQNCSFP